VSVPPKPAPDPKEARLAQALRANLRRRKAAEPVEEPAPAPESGPDGVGRS
jgi:hypothetical protein